MADQPAAAAELQQKYRQFLDLLPLTTFPGRSPSQ